MHYTPIGQVRFDRTSVGVILAKEPPRHLAITRGIAGWGLKIPPGAPDHVQRAAWTSSQGSSLAEHDAAHAPARQELSLPGPLSRRPRRNAAVGARLRFQLAERLSARRAQAAPRGTTIHCEAHFDNSAANPANPDPGQTVLWGEQTWDEMMIGFIDYYEDAPIAPSSVAQRGPSHP